ncbi:MAG: UDP-2,3-diacylglucosamine diphosphatase [Bacteroidia bacterium]|nr:UDP-2,3-diacylglucosamine diphosphatase [Bacteroidia bacterium]
MKRPKLKFRSVIVSDVHLGAPGCRIDEVNHFLKHIKCKRLILNGDIIDSWQLKRRSGYWSRKHSQFIKIVLNKVVKDDTKVIYLRGNHDDILDRFLPISFAGVFVTDKYVLRSAQGDYLVVHGDIFDAITTHLKWLAKLGDIGYNWLLKINRYYNAYRAWRGKPYYSLSARIKAKVKGAVSFISSFEETLVDIARQRNFKGVICGHIHTAADKDMNGVHYLNSGDWVESLTAIVEHTDGRFEVIEYAEFLRRLDQKAQQRALKAQLREQQLALATGQ